MEAYISLGFVALSLLITVLMKSKNKNVLSFFPFLNNVNVKEAKGNFKRIPGPVSLPILGTLPHVILKLRNPFKYNSFDLLDELKRIWGSPIKMTLGKTSLVLFDDLPTIKKILNSEDWTNRLPDNPIFKSRTFGDNFGLLTSDGESWREMRRYIQKTLIKFGFGRSSSLEMRHEEEILKLFKHLDTKLELNSSVLQMNGLFNITALNILWEMVASIRYPYESEEITKLTQMLENFASNVHPKELGFLAFPWLRHIPGATGYNTLMRDVHTMQDYFRIMINNRRSTGIYKTEQNNFVDSFLAEIDYHKDNKVEPNYYTDEQLIMVLLDLFLTGFLPIASCLEYLIMFMILNPRVQQKCQEEIDSVVGQNRYPSINDTESLPYVQATCIEVLRKVTLIPLTSRTAVKDTFVDGYFLPKGTMAGINLYAVHHNPEVFDSPGEFRPERFLDSDGKVTNQDTILPFGTGKRVCPAEVFGRLSTFTFFAYLMQRYSFENPEDDPLPDDTPNSSMGNYPKGYRALIKNRH